jgi:GTPase SAR1 family protein
MKDGHVKILLLGSAATGKSCILHRYYGKRYEPCPTIGVEVTSNMLVKKNQQVCLRFYDMGGARCWWWWIPTHIRDTDLVFLFYDVTRPDTLSEAGEILQGLHEYRNQFRVILVGNKTDREEERQVSIFDANTFLQEMKSKGWMLNHIETNVDNITAFVRILKKIIFGIKSHRTYSKMVFADGAIDNRPIWSKYLFNWQ